MAQMVPATPGMFDDFLPLLRELNPALTKEQWRLLVDYGWRDEGDGLGWALVESGEVVGFLSTLYSRRLIDGMSVRFCNTAHWVVRPSHRADSLRLLMTVLRQTDCTFTNLTSSAQVAAMFGRLGFKVLDRNVILLFPEPVAPCAVAAVAAAVTFDRDEIRASLRPEDRTIFDDHAAFPCGHALLREGDRYCYLVYTRLERRILGVRVPYGHIHYVSDKALLQRHLARVKWHFLWQMGAWFLAVDERMLGTRPRRFAKLHPLGQPRYYRSDALSAEQIDNLYTELALGVY